MLHLLLLLCNEPFPSPSSHAEAILAQYLIDMIKPAKLWCPVAFYIYLKIMCMVCCKKIIAKTPEKQFPTPCSATFQCKALRILLCILCGHEVKAVPACGNKSTAVTAELGKTTWEH